MNTSQQEALQNDPRNLPERLADAGRELLATAAGLDDDALAAPSVLPGWSRGFVLAHVEGVCRAMTRQLEYAARGETVDFYDDGSDGRNRDIERRAQRATEEQLHSLTDAVSTAVAVFAGVTGSEWTTRISYRDGTVRDGALALWRELVIHASDLGLRRTSLDWDNAFCHYLFEFLEARIPAGTAIKLQPLGEQPRTLLSGSGTPARTVVVTGLLQDIAAWLAGRQPLGGLNATAAADGVDLPELLPWPSAMAPRG
ncbi:maleylpyruvate isomerase family mycothiol-dependent enzyme [Arthrobacter tumbae]|uniref:maleylpyruvate isomerase family mycothiol-dependent enzyme n=1 Tax=Arthrobacter tumbae TaxID=163874 RepID=UPI0027DEA456|nr:maleylpyruvate isomerase family mycothiol-dependent enzyme [Arthrobacter tumbae]MBM7782789.1 maleylpyruvate isomerase [Arthrobacter tumbae]